MAERGFASGCGDSMSTLTTLDSDDGFESRRGDEMYHSLDLYDSDDESCESISMGEHFAERQYCDKMDFAVPSTKGGAYGRKMKEFVFDSISKIWAVEADDESRDKHLKSLKEKVKFSTSEAEVKGLISAETMGSIIMTSSMMIASAHATNDNLREGKSFAKKIKQIFREAQNVDLCFVMDTTGSMESYMSGVREYINKIVEQVRKRHSRFEPRLGFVGYKDWNDGKEKIFTFKQDVDLFKEFISALKADGGDDTHENVLHGMKAALNLKWQSPTKIIIHILDAPPHGRQFGSHGDNDADWLDKPDHRYKGVEPLDLFTGMASAGKSSRGNDALPIHYLFVDCKPGGTILNETRREFRKAVNRVRSDQMMSELEWFVNFTDTSTPLELVKVVTKTINSAVMTVTASQTLTLSNLKNVGVRKSATKTKSPLVKFHLPASVKWNELTTYRVEVCYYPPPNAVDFRELGKDGLTILPEILRCKIQHAPIPFAEGGCRLAYHGRQWVNRFNKNMVVLKKSKKEGGADLQRDCQNQSILNYFVKLYNNELKKSGITTVKLEVIDSYLVTNADIEMTFEPYLGGCQLVKFNNNAGSVNEGAEYSDLAMCFSWFTYITSRKRLMIVDIQGFLKVYKGVSSIILTDPVIHNRARPGVYGRTDYGEQGMKLFKKSYFDLWEKNKYHKAIGLADLRSS